MAWWEFLIATVVVLIIIYFGFIYMMASKITNALELSHELSHVPSTIIVPSYGGFGRGFGGFGRDFGRGFGWKYGRSGHRGRH